MNQSGASFGHKDSGVSIYEGIECSQEFIDSNIEIHWEEILFSTIYIALLITGVTSNLLVCVVILKKPEMQTFTNKLVFNLAVIDILLLMTSQTIVAFSVERYLAICHPLSSYTRSASSRPLRIIAAIWLTAFVMAFPFGYGSDTETLPYQLVNDLDEVCVVNFEVCSIFHVLGYAYKTNKTNIIYIFLTLYFVIPSIILLFMYGRIAVTLLNQKQIGESGTRNSISPNHLATAMLAIIVLSFFLCWTPYYISILYDSSVSSNTFWNIAMALIFLSSTLNACLYNLMSSKFRKAFKDTICCKLNRTSATTPNLCVETQATEV
ncbi:Hypothetical predicted protein [Cloeon dipterum]|uniref:G-protein coupled receptors family 1 profile domain-containing protein n=1 Tax=Cloeon dipterum TaxID=197152 RepID=A0A8S1DED5_9INSE|nr:Hypothetical predicted protein [Cloeon dipterum]